MDRVISEPCCKGTILGVQWLNGRVLDSRRRGRRSEPHRLHCNVSLSKIHLSLL